MKYPPIGPERASRLSTSDPFGMPTEAHLVPVWPKSRKPIGPAFTGSESAARWFGALADAPVERAVVVPLDSQNRPLGAVIASQGSVGGTDLHPREVFAPAIAARARSVMLFHNHPSGVRRPSPEDIAATERFVQAGKLLGIPLLDHIIVARGGDYTSMRGDAMVQFNPPRRRRNPKRRSRVNPRARWPKKVRARLRSWRTQARLHAIAPIWGWELVRRGRKFADTAGNWSRLQRDARVLRQWREVMGTNSPRRSVCRRRRTRRGRR